MSSFLLPSSGSPPVIRPSGMSCLSKIVCLMKIAREHKTGLDDSRLSGGVCYTFQDGGPQSGCNKVPDGGCLKSL